MKKVLLLFLIVAMSFGLMACDSKKNDENNALMQAKLDEAESLVQEIRNWYKEEGLLEGDTAAEVQEMVNTSQGQIDEMKAQFKEIFDMGGFSDEDVADIGPILDATIAEYKKAMELLEDYSDSAAAGIGIGALGEKYNQFYDLVMEGSVLALENGWSEDEAFRSELDASLALLEVIKNNLDNPDSMDEAYMNELSAAFDEMIPTWQDYVVQVSKPYTGNK